MDIERMRRQMHTAITRMVDDDPPDDGPVVVTAWACVATVRYADGGSRMYRITGDAVGDRELATWEVDGMLHYAIYDWKAGDPDD
jgi:hypothetical protein